MNDKQVDDLLKEIERHDWELTAFNKEIDVENIKIEDVIEIFNKSIHISYLMEELGLIRFIQVIQETNFYGFTKKGRKVVRLGGWLKYLERQDEIEKKKELKQNYELKIIEFQAKNPRLPYYIAIGSFILAMFSFIKSCSTEERTLLSKQEMKPYKKEQPILQNNNLEDSTKVLKKK
jgi:hypothetical protein